MKFGRRATHSLDFVRRFSPGSGHLSSSVPRTCCDTGWAECRGRPEVGSLVKKLSGPESESFWANAKVAYLRD